MRFCGRCGAVLARTCEHCHFANPAAFAFCGRCGAALASAAKPRAAGSPLGPRSREALPPGARAEAAFEAATALAVAIDIAPEPAGDLDVEQRSELLAPFLSLARTSIDRFEGDVIEEGPTALAALFADAEGRPERAAERACLAALQIRDGLRQRADEVRRRSGVAVDARIGVGPALGAEDARGGPGDSRSIGPARLALRLRRAAPGGCALVAEETRSLVAAGLRFRDLGPLELPGRRDSLRLYELDAVAGPSPGRETGHRRSGARMVDREDELRALAEAFERAREGEAQIVGVSGNAGVGKSRLCREFLGRCRDRGATTVVARCPPHARAAPLAFLVATLRAHLGVGEDDDAELCRDKITGRLLRADGRLAPEIPFVLDLLGVPDPGRAPLRAPAEERERHIRQLLEVLVASRSVQAPLVVLIEDAHWIDSTSEAFLAAPPQGSRCLVLQTFRPGFTPASSRSPGYRGLEVPALRPADATELAARLLGPSAGSALAEHVAARSAGSPLYVEEAVLLLGQTGALVGGPGRYRTRQNAPPAALPDSLTALVAARIEALGPAERGVLEAAAVLGGESAPGSIADVARASADEVEVLLDRLNELGLLVRRTRSRGPAYAFRHPLLQEVAYAGQPAAERRRRHGAAAALLERRHPERLGESAGLIARHLANAGRSDEAALWHARAAEWVERVDAAAAAHHWRRVRDLAERFPEPPSSLALAATACGRLLRQATRLGLDEREAAELYHRGEELARRAADRPALARIQSCYGLARWEAGHVRDSVGLLEEAVRTADGLRDPALRAATRAALLLAAHETRRAAEELRLADEVVELTDREVRLGAEEAGFSPYLLAEVLRARALLAAGRVSEARQQLERADHLAETYRDPAAEGAALFERIRQGRLLGERPDAARAAERAEALCAGRPLERVGARAILGWTLLLEGSLRRADEQLAAALLDVREHRALVPLEPFLLSGIALARLALGDLESARLAVEEAALCARARAMRDLECEAQVLRASILRQTEGRRAEEAIAAALERASALVERTGHRIHAPAIREQRARLEALRGDREAAASELRAARDLYAEMDAWAQAARLAEELGA